MKIILTKSGFAKINKDRENLLKERPLAVLDLKKARDMGDLSENGYYKAAKGKLIDIDRSIRQVNFLIKFAVIADDPKKGIAGICSTVNLKISDVNKKYLIVGDHEADPMEGKISFMSPIGKALLNKKVGEIINIDTPSGAKRSGKITKINP
jgi:transcription elongation factor GreA